MNKFLYAALIFSFSLFSNYAIAKTAVDNIDVSEVWIQKNTVTNNAALYMTVQNNNDQDVVILGASASETANTVEIHNHVNDNNVMKMVKLDKVLVPQNSSIQFKTGGMHIMLNCLKHKLESGDKVNVTLLTDQGTKEIEASVK